MSTCPMIQGSYFQRRISERKSYFDVNFKLSFLPPPLLWERMLSGKAKQYSCPPAQDNCRSNFSGESYLVFLSQPPELLTSMNQCRLEIDRWSNERLRNQSLDREPFQRRRQSSRRLTGNWTHTHGGLSSFLLAAAAARRLACRTQAGVAVLI